MEYGIVWAVAALAVAVVISFCAIFFDYRFLILALIWIFIIIPFSVFFLFLIYGLQPLTTINKLNHRLNFLDDSVIVKFNDSEDEAETPNPIQDWKISNADVAKIKYGTDYVIFFFDGDRKGFLWLPIHGLSSKENMRDVIDNFTDQLNKNTLIKNEDTKRQ